MQFLTIKKRHVSDTPTPPSHRLMSCTYRFVTDYYSSFQGKSLMHFCIEVSSSTSHALHKNPLMPTCVIKNTQSHHLFHNTIFFRANFYVIFNTLILSPYASFASIRLAYVCNHTKIISINNVRLEILHFFTHFFLGGGKAVRITSLAFYHMVYSSRAIPLAHLNTLQLILFFISGVVSGYKSTITPIEFWL